MYIPNAVERMISFSEDIRRVQEKMKCIFNIVAASTERFQCILEVAFNLVFMKVTKP